ncbi:hypothetical protein ACPPVT_03225 [Angustibacter sp. McL0619]|uniref:hypothetical protein n=1 Tax=Angustibacter sp. McL0619 TaxID=3415676 RepID=UPI003CF43847
MLMSSLDTGVVLGVFSALAVAAFVWAIRDSIRRRDVLPVAACVGALICSLNEPIYDFLGKLVYARDNPVAFTAFDRSIPWFLVFSYVPWVGLLPYLIARAIGAGMSRGRLHAVAAGSFTSVVVVEFIGTSLHTWGYYGVVPLKFLPVAPQMAAAPIVTGFLLYTSDQLLRGWHRIFLVVIPTLAFPMVFASVSWPLYVANHSDLAPVANWLVAIVMLCLTVAVIGGTTALAARWREMASYVPVTRSGVHLVDHRGEVDTLVPHGLPQGTECVERP